MMHVNFSDVRGLADVVSAVATLVRDKKRFLLEGAPGIGKTMIARRITTILPPLNEHEKGVLERIYRAAGLFRPAYLGLGEDFDASLIQRPFRAPHHTVSALAMLGTSKNGGRYGEIDLAEYGVLMLDELPEFSRSVIRNLGLDLDIAQRDVWIVATANPCPCGWHGSKERQCACLPDTIARYRRALDQRCEMLGIDERITIPSVSLRDLRNTKPGESSESIRARIWEGNNART